MNYEATEYTREDGVVLARIGDDRWVIRSSQGSYHYHPIRREWSDDDDSLNRLDLLIYYARPFNVAMEIFKTVKPASG